LKYSEFEREVEREGFNVDRKSGTAYVDSTTDTVMSISTDDLFMFDCDWSAFVHLNRDVQEQLFDLAYQLAKTPLTERENEKKYNVILPNILRDRKPILLLKSFDDHESCGIDWSPKDWLDDHMDRHIFTEQEIKDIDERYLAFKVEVTE
jgi:hypothetical protein